MSKLVWVRDLDDEKEQFQSLMSKKMLREDSYSKENYRRCKKQKPITVKHLIAHIEQELENGNYHRMMSLPTTLLKALKKAKCTDEQIMTFFETIIVDHGSFVE